MSAQPSPRRSPGMQTIAEVFEDPTNSAPPPSRLPTGGGGPPKAPPPPQGYYFSSPPPEQTTPARPGAAHLPADYTPRRVAPVRRESAVVRSCGNDTQRTIGKRDGPEISGPG